MNTKVSVVVPVYKVEKFIDQCVRSIQNQTYNNLEIILVDDGSPDTCPAICDTYAAQDDRIKVIHQENAGLSKAREKGLRQATGEYVAFVDSDDWIEENAIEELLSAAEQYNADIVICDWKVFEKEHPNGLALTQESLEGASLSDIREGFLLDRFSNFMWNKMYRRSLLDGIVFADRMIYEDLYIMAELICRCNTIHYLKKPLFCYRIHASTTNTSSKIKVKEGLFKAWREHERVCVAYQIRHPLPYCRLRAQEAAISLLLLNQAEPVSPPALLAETEAYLKESEANPADGLPVSAKLEWWALKHVPFLAGVSGRLHLWADYWQNKRKYG